VLIADSTQASGVRWGLEQDYGPRPSDAGFLAWNGDPNGAATAFTPLGVAGTLYGALLRTHTPISVTNLAAYIGTAGATLTSGQCFMALYDASKNLVGVTADQSAAWVSTGWKTAALVSGPFTVQPGVFYVVMWFNGTTGPAPLRFNGAAGVPNGLSAAASSRFFTSNTGQTTTAPGSLTTFSATGNPIFLGVS
jgi:hypothetical protein